jgi:hypothetical protein
MPLAGEVGMSSAILLAAIVCGLPAGSVVKLIQDSESTTGTVVAFLEDGDGLILTCNHGRDAKKPVDVLIQRKAWSKGKVLAYDKDLDVALVKAPVGKGFDPIPLGDDPEKGDCLVAGFGDHNYLERRSKIKYISKDGWLHIESPGRAGDSGGPVLVDGKLVGVHLRGQDGLKGDGKARSISVLRDWIAENRPDTEKRGAPSVKSPAWRSQN